MFGKSKIIKELKERNRKLEEELSVAKDKSLLLDKFQEAFPISMFSIDRDRKVLNFNNEFINLTGFSKFEIEQSKGAAYILWPKEPSECKVCKLAVKYINERRSGNGEAFVTTKSGVVVPVYVYVVPIIIDRDVVQTYILLRDRRNEIAEREQYVQDESLPIIEMLKNLTNGMIDKPLVINDDSELKLLEKPVNNIRTNLQDIITQITTSTDNILTMTTNSVDSLSNTTSTIDELTQKIFQSKQDIENMSSHTQEVTSSLHNELELANQTVSSMEQINEQVNLINDSISVIDQIAFQTNILSLNAAVEAATAGEAGKGFAVVAQEVRNLASRSAEAAKDIKDIVENATSKANDGKNISSKMIEGFSKLNHNIADMSNIIELVTKSSEEQQENIDKINDAIIELSNQIKQSANIAKESQHETYAILHISA